MQTKVRRIEWFRVWIDLLIVMTYAYLLVNATDLLGDPDHSVNAFLLGYPVIFALYLIWGILRRQTYSGAPTNRLWLLFFSAIVFLAISLSYRLIPGDVRAGNEASLSIIIVAVVAYRIKSGRLHSGQS